MSSRSESSRGLRKPIRVEQRDEQPIRVEQSDEQPIRVEPIDEQPIRVEQRDEQPIRVEQGDEQPIRGAGLLRLGLHRHDAAAQMPQVRESKQRSGHGEGKAEVTAQCMDVMAYIRSFSSNNLPIGLTGKEALHLSSQGEMWARGDLSRISGEARCWSTFWSTT